MHNILTSGSRKIIDLATKRKTCRVFSNAQVNLEEVLYCIKVAVQAPSGANSQPWRFMIVDDLKVKAKVRTTCERLEKRFQKRVRADLKRWLISKGITYKKSFLTDASTLLVVFSDQTKPYATESTWLAIGYILLSLEEKGLSTVTYTPSYPEVLNGVFGAPSNFKLESILPIGYSIDLRSKEKRDPLHSFVYVNSWGSVYPTDE
ncbi:MAG: nitroreductase family protein [Nitrososphaeria archaeon]